ncbi:MAG: M1 family metallopeptidase [Solirubrobacterales bacterium]
MRRALLLAALTALLLPATAGATPKPGSLSAGDPLFPQIGNGGYDALHYDLDLDYDPAANTLGPGTRTTITADATQDLSSFGLDFQRDLAISAVTVDGAAATFERRDAKPRLSPSRDVTQPAKLIVTPASPLAKGSRFTVVVEYSGTPKPIVDLDHSEEGWVRACSKQGECDGSFTVNEPIGAQSWFPCNNHMSDKATVTTSITAPDGYTALGAGELAAKTSAGDGRTTWKWVESHPTATYLTTATTGRYDFTTGSMRERTAGSTLPVYGAIASDGPRKLRDIVTRNTRDIPAMVNFLAKRFGAYPFGSVGFVAGWVPAVGYALENQTKPHFAGTERGPEVNRPELLHELAHQWMGDNVTGRTWQQIWFNEGWATFAEVYWGAKVNDSGLSPRQFFRRVLEIDKRQYRRPPADLGNARHLFNVMPVYNRPGAMIEGYREIVGNKRFFGFARKLTAKHQYGTISEGEFVRAAKRESGLDRRGERRLGAYFRQWLHRAGRPQITPADFR